MIKDEFQRKERYIVFKLSDVEDYFYLSEIPQLLRFSKTQQVMRERTGKPPLECVVVEKDWPEYEPTWKAIEARVMGAKPAPEVLSDLTSLLREVTDILKWYGNGLHIKRLSGRIDWDAERAKLSRENFEHSFELYDGTEYYVEDGSRACQLVDKLENALDLAGNINSAQPAQGEEARLVSYHPDGDTCTLNINGVEMYYDRVDRNTQPAPSVPDGWKLVPIEPTPKMIDAAEYVDWGDADVRGSCINAWNRMLSVAPEVKP